MQECPNICPVHQSVAALKALKSILEGEHQRQHTITVYSLQLNVTVVKVLLNSFSKDFYFNL